MLGIVLTGRFATMPRAFFCDVKVDSALAVHMVTFNLELAQLWVARSSGARCGKARSMHVWNI